MNENEEFDKKIYNINYSIERLINYFDYYFSLERILISQKYVGCGDVLITHYTCRNYTNLILLIKYLEISELQWLEDDLINKLVYFDKILNKSLDEKIKVDEAIKICIETEQREALYLLYCFYITLSDETFNNDYLQYLDCKEDLISTKGMLKRFLNDSRLEQISDLLQENEETEE